MIITSFHESRIWCISRTVSLFFLEAKEMKETKEEIRCLEN